MWGGWWRRGRVVEGRSGEGGREGCGEGGGVEDVGRVVEKGKGGGGEDVERVVEVTNTVTIPVGMSLK